MWASTESTQVEEATQAASIISESAMRNCKNDLCLCILGNSHPGYFGKYGMRHFHLKRNQYFCPSINLDKLWTLVSEVTYLKAKKRAAEGKDLKAVVIDCVKAVRIFGYQTSIGLLQGSWQRRAS